MFMVIGEFLLCCFVVVGSVLISKSYPKIAEALFFAYAAFILFNYFAVRWKYERLKWNVIKFKRLRKKMSGYEFGMPPLVTGPAAPKTVQKKSK
jgi:hypothetical protein